MNLFVKNLSSSSTEIKEARATLIGGNAEYAQSKLLMKLKSDLRDLESKEQELSDLFPESELSLLVTKKTFDGDSWTSQLQDVGVKILNKQVEIKVAQANYDKWFKEDESLSK